MFQLLIVYPPCHGLQNRGVLRLFDLNHVVASTNLCYIQTFNHNRCQRQIVWVMANVLSSTSSDSNEVYCISEVVAAFQHPSEVPAWQCESLAGSAFCAGKALRDRVQFLLHVSSVISYLSERWRLVDDLVDVVVVLVVGAVVVLFNSKLLFYKPQPHLFTLHLQRVITLCNADEQIPT